MSFSIDVFSHSSPNWHIIVCDGDVLVAEQAENVLIPYSAQHTEAAVFEYNVGYFNQQQVNVVLVAEQQAIQYQNWGWVSLRALMTQLSPDTFTMVGRAIQLSRWHQEHQYCGRCGSETRSTDGGRARGCLTCNLHFYPKISPCVIGIIVNADKCLLARNAKHPKGMYSTIAGFIEAGETAEMAFAREVYEEVGVKIRNIQYTFSQSWPFPGQLMLGFIADYASGDIKVDNEEILEAYWFNRDNLPQTPPMHTISGRLIEGFVQNTLR